MNLPAKLAHQAIFTLTQSTDNFHHFTDSPFSRKSKKQSNDRFGLNQQPKTFSRADKFSRSKSHHYDKNNMGTRFHRYLCPT